MAPKWGPWLAERPSSVRSLRTHRHDRLFLSTHSKQRDTTEITHDMLKDHRFHFALHEKLVEHRFHLWVWGWGWGLGPGLGAGSQEPHWFAYKEAIALGRAPKH